MSAFYSLLRYLLTLFLERKPVIVPADPVIIQPRKPVMPEETTPDPVPTSIDTLLPWNTTKSLSHENWHNVRVLCDLEGLSPELKEELCATVWGESEFNVNAHNYNYAFNSAGAKYLSSTDFGICQWNDWFHGKEISPTDAIGNPEKAVRLMCQYFLEGRQDQWCAHSSGRYKQFLGKTL